MTDTDALAAEGDSSYGPLLVAGIGASAGGVSALKDFFSAVVPGSGIAYVVVLHLSPDHESNLAEVLQAVSAIPVRQLHERVRLEADHAYVVPPNGKLSVSDGAIEVAPLGGPEERRAPIDLFLRTLAEAARSSAACVILSGTGADGSVGFMHVKEFGGLCVAQEPADAQFADMPRHAIGTGLADWVLPARRIPERLAAYRQHRHAVTPPEAEPAEARAQALADIFTQLRVRTGHDFAHYKRSTVMRRIGRRMAVRELARLPEYARFLRENRDEAPALLKDFLISVTGFFRDPSAFEALGAKVLPRLFEGRGASDQVRVWVAGCATGEEAYSIAMMLAERGPEPADAPMIQVFATDIDEAALARARSGLYSVNDTLPISPERLRRFFAKDGDQFRIRRELRETVLFASHNVIKDPPFSHLDLVLCRNLLIYLDREAQDRIVKLFHFGLRPGGFLFLGNSESADESGNLFVAVDKDAHIFQSREVQTPLAHPPVAATPARPVNLDGAVRVEARTRERLSLQDLHQRLLEQYAPPSLIVNREFDILHLTERAGRYLHHVGGEPSQNLLKVVRPELRLELHGALSKALQTRGRTEAVAEAVPLNGHAESVKIVVSPVLDESDSSRGLMLVVFDRADGPVVPRAGPSPSAGEGASLAQHLEEELVRVKLQLRTTIEQYELQQEELKASNEELQAMNEELRSSSEELETSKEELQSVNEELTTVNQELKTKIDELSHVNNDTRNLMNSTDLATLFVDRGLRIMFFTPRARSLFNLIPADIGRPLLDITNRLRYPDLVPDIERVLETLATTEREVESTDGRWYIARLLPYRTAEDRIAGVVLTFTDISERRRAEQAVREGEERVRLVVASLPDFAIFTLDPEGRIETWSAGAENIFGYTEAEAVGHECAFLAVPEDRAAGVPERELQQARESGQSTDERWFVRKDGSRVFVSGVVAPMHRDGKLVGYTRMVRDLTERRRIESEEARVRLLRELVRAQEDERRRISRELHDQLGQEVTAIGLKLNAIKSSPGLSEAMRAELEKLEGVVRRLDDDVEFLVWELRPTGLDDLGLPEALADFVSGWSRYFDLPAQLHSRLSRRLTPDVETVIYRIAQEALNNVAKHARAKSVRLDLVDAGPAVTLTVVDDGQGFDPWAPLKAKGFGLVGMRERAALVGGRTDIESEPGKGTVVKVSIPS